MDTREQPTQRARERYARFSVPYRHCALGYGDYTYNFRRPDGTWLHTLDRTIEPDVAVERKMGLGELAQCYTWSRGRFSGEFDKAAGKRARMYLLVEDASWENLINGKYRGRYNPNAYLASVTAWMARYGTGVIFCKEQTSSRMIQEILYRELKERLERGEYDG